MALTRVATETALMSNIARLIQQVTLLALFGGGWVLAVFVLQSEAPERSTPGVLSSAPGTMTPNEPVIGSAADGPEHVGSGSAGATQSAPQKRVAGHVPDRFARRIVSAFGVDDQRAQALTKPLLEAAQSEGVDAMIFSAVVMTESSFRPSARSSKGAIGPAQVVPKWWERGLCSELDLLRTRDNLRCGARVLSHYTDRCEGQVMCALRYYNVGPSAMQSDDPAAWSAGLRYQRKVTDYWGALLRPEQRRLARVD